MEGNIHYQTQTKPLLCWVVLRLLGGSPSILQIFLQRKRMLLLTWLLLCVNVTWIWENRLKRQMFKRWNEGSVWGVPSAKEGTGLCGRLMNLLQPEAFWCNQVPGALGLCLFKEDQQITKCWIKGGDSLFFFKNSNICYHCRAFAV